MILIEGQKIYCKGCGKIIENIYDSCILLNIEANEKSPLYCLNEAIFHRDCYNNYPLRNMYEKRVAELEKLSSLNNFDYISKNEFSILDLLIYLSDTNTMRVRYSNIENGDLETALPMISVLGVEK